MRPKLLLVAPLLVLALATAHASTRSSPTTAVAAVAPVIITTTTDWPDPYEALRPAIARQEAEARWYAEAIRQYDERVAAEAEAAARAATQPQPSSGTAAAVTSGPEPVAVGSGDAHSAIAEHFGDMYGSAVGVAQCESGLDPGAISDGGGNWGLFQINTVHKDSFTAVTGHPWSEVLNANLNAMFARWLYNSSGGWGPWACRWAA